MCLYVAAIDRYGTGRSGKYLQNFQFHILKSGYSAIVCEKKLCGFQKIGSFANL